LKWRIIAFNSLLAQADGENGQIGTRTCLKRSIRKSTSCSLQTLEFPHLPFAMTNSLSAKYLEDARANRRQLAIPAGLD
jgi:hypothetical protein